jgi:hypothetical protein
MEAPDAIRFFWLLDDYLHVLKGEPIARAVRKLTKEVESAASLRFVRMPSRCGSPQGRCCTSREAGAGSSMLDVPLVGGVGYGLAFEGLIDKLVSVYI